MKLPEYTLKREITIPDGFPSFQSTTFLSGTLIFPFWNEDYVPDHRYDELVEARKFRQKDSDRLIMCLIGTRWVPVEQSNIRKNE